MLPAHFHNPLDDTRNFSDSPVTHVTILFNINNIKQTDPPPYQVKLP